MKRNSNKWANGEFSWYWEANQLHCCKRKRGKIRHRISETRDIRVNSVTRHHHAAFVASDMHSLWNSEITLFNENAILHYKKKYVILSHQSCFYNHLHNGFLNILSRFQNIHTKNNHSVLQGKIDVMYLINKSELFSISRLWTHKPENAKRKNRDDILRHRRNSFDAVFPFKYWRYIGLHVQVLRKTSNESSIFHSRIYSLQIPLLESLLLRLYEATEKAKAPKLFKPRAQRSPIGVKFKKGQNWYSQNLILPVKFGLDALPQCD